MIITRLSNAGTAITLHGKTVIVDALHTGCVDPYLGSDMALVEEQHADCVAFTHAHPDHFNAEVAANYLYDNPELPVLCGPHARGELISQGIAACRFLDLDSQLGELRLFAFPTRHIGPAWKEYEHFAITLGDDEVMVTGDATPTESNFAGHTARVLIAPFAYALANSGFRAVRNTIGAKELVVVHMPLVSNDPEQLNARLCAGVDTLGVNVHVPLIGDTLEL